MEDLSLNPYSPPRQPPSREVEKIVKLEIRMLDLWSCIRLGMYLAIFHTMIMLPILTAVGLSLIGAEDRDGRVQLIEWSIWAIQLTWSASFFLFGSMAGVLLYYGQRILLRVSGDLTGRGRLQPSIFPATE